MYYGARYYNPRVSLWLNVDPLADYNPFYNSEHYIDGEHNEGVYNSGNLNPFIYCYQNPMIYKDPDGKQVTVVDGVRYHKVLVVQKTVLWEGQASRYRIQKTNEYETSRSDRNFTGAIEYQYTVFPKGSRTSVKLTGQNSTADLQNQYSNNYDYDALQAHYKAYDNMNDAASLGGDSSLFLEMLNKTKASAIIGAIAQGFKATNSLLYAYEAYQVNDYGKLKEIGMDWTKEYGVDKMAGILGKIKNSKAEKQFKLWAAAMEKIVEQTKSNDNEKK